MREPFHFYMVSEWVSTFGKDKGQNDSLTHEELFKEGNLKTCRENANKYYIERLKGIEEKGRYFFPFASYENFESGKNAAYSIAIYLVEFYNDEEFYLIPVEGEDEEDCKDGRKTEQMLFMEK